MFKLASGIILNIIYRMAKNNAIKKLNPTHNNIFGQNLSNDRQAIARHRVISSDNSIINS